MGKKAEAVELIKKRLLETPNDPSLWYVTCWGKKAYFSIFPFLFFYLLNYFL